MAKEKTALMTDRAARLYRLITLLGKKPLNRDALTNQIGIGVRAFYRDLESLRDVGIEVELVEGKYRLATGFNKALSLLPFPDPQLTWAEAEQLAKGRTKAHQKLRKKLAEFKSTKKPRRRSRS